MSDALSSYRDRRVKRQILRDPHIGAFAVIGLVVIGLIFLFGLTQLRTPVQVAFFCGSFALSRICSGLAAFYLPKFDEEDNLTQTVAMQNRPVVLAVLWLELAAWMLCYARVSLPVLAVELVAMGMVFFYYRWKMCREFGGTVGDTAGWYVVVQETVFVVMLAIWGMAGGF